MTNPLNDDLWYIILKDLSHKELLISCMPVCRSWRSLTLELLGDKFFYPGEWVVRPVTNFERDTTSIQAYILRQASRLKSVDIVFSSASESEMQGIMTTLSNCKQLDSMVWGSFNAHYPVDLSTFPSSLKSLEILWLLPGNFQQPHWTISHSSLPALTSLTSRADKQGVTEQVAKLTNLKSLKLSDCSERRHDHLSHLSSLTNLTFLNLEDLCIVDSSVQELLLGLPHLREAELFSRGPLRSDFDLGRLQRHPSCPILSIWIDSCTETAFHAMMASHFVTNFDVSYIAHPGFEEIYQSLDWGKVNKTELSLPCIKNLVVDWAQIFTAPKLKTLKLYASKSISFRNMDLLSKAALESKGLQFNILLDHPYSGQGPNPSEDELSEEISQEIRQHFEAEGLCFSDELEEGSILASNSYMVKP